VNQTSAEEAGSQSDAVTPMTARLGHRGEYTATHLSGWQVPL